MVLSIIESRRSSSNPCKNGLAKVSSQPAIPAGNAVGCGAAQLNLPENQPFAAGARTLPWSENTRGADRER